MIYDLFSYSERVAGESGQMFCDLPYLHILCDTLEACVTGSLPDGKRNLLINIPPRHYKTTFASRNFVAWALAEIAPDCEFLLTSYAAELAVDNALAVRRILSMPWHQSQYPGLEISKKDKDVQKYFRTTSGGAVYATGIGGSITGFGAGKTRGGFGGAIIIDDPLKAGDARSAVALKNCIQYYLSTLKNRRNNAHTTPIILIMQRLHVDDLSGWLLKNEGDTWHQVLFPAVDAKGEHLNPITTIKAELEALRIIDPAQYYGQYQQTPIVPGGNMIKLSWWTLYDPAELRGDGLHFITADTAFKEKEANDCSVLQHWVGREDGLYFVDSAYGRWDFPKLMRNSELFYKVSGEPREFWIEDKASGTPLEQMLSMAGVPARAWSPGQFGFPADKVARMQAAAWYVHGGRVYLPKGEVPVRVDDGSVVYVSPGAAALMEEAAAFSATGTHAHDDHCDAFTMAISLYRDAGGVV